MNIVQLMKKARFGVDAILPGASVSSMWGDEEVADIVNTSYEEVLRRYRLARKKWGMRTVRQDDSAFTMEGETYTPSTALSFVGVPGRPTTVSLPPDFGEIVRIVCLNNRTVRFLPYEMESAHWTDYEQRSMDLGGQSLLMSSPDGLIFHYDLINMRTLILTPPTTGTFNIQVDYIPLKRPLFYSTVGTIAQSGTALTGTNTTWVTDNIFTENTGNAAELIPGTDDVKASFVNLNKDYARVASITSNTAAVMIQSATISSGTKAILAMVPVLPRDVHRWIADYASTIMLKKVNPEIADKFGNELMVRFNETIRPTAGRRQGQESTMTEDAEEFGVTSAY
jgi:hypothetical protein